MKAVIFDFNGTLFWDSPKHDEAWNAFSMKYRGMALTEDELEKLHGRNNRTTIEYILNRTVSTEECLILADEKEQFYRALCEKDKENIQLAPGAVDFIQFLTENHIPHAIASSAGKDNIEFYRKIFKLDELFNPKNIIYDHGDLPSKPDPALYLLALETLGSSPNETLVIEDAEIGIQSASNANIKNIFAIGPADKHAYLSSIPGVTATIQDFSEIDRNLFI